METTLNVSATATDWVNTEIDLEINQYLHITASGFVWALAGNDTYKSDPDGGSAGFEEFCAMRMPSAPPMSLIGKIGTGDPFFVGSNFEINSSEKGILYLEANDCPSSHGDNAGSFSVTIVTANTDETRQNGPADCPFSHNPDSLGADPISLKTGEKFESMTDLRINSPMQGLDFTRSYRQSKLDKIGRAHV